MTYVATDLGGPAVAPRTNDASTLIDRRPFNEAKAAYAPASDVPNEAFSVNGSPTLTRLSQRKSGGKGALLTGGIALAAVVIVGGIAFLATPRKAIEPVAAPAPVASTSVATPTAAPVASVVTKHTETTTKTTPAPTVAERREAAPVRTAKTVQAHHATRSSSEGAAARSASPEASTASAAPAPATITPPAPLVVTPPAADTEPAPQPSLVAPAPTAPPADAAPAASAAPANDGQPAAPPAA